MNAVPARVFGIKARDGNTVTLFRRGPSKLVQLLVWDLKSDQVKEGQWLKLAVYPRRADLSPDGRHLIYFAASHKGSGDANFTAISRPPYWTALHFYGQSHAWNGGGLFLDNKRYWPDLGFGSSSTRKIPSGLTRAQNPPGFINEGMGEDTVVYLPRLERDGWTPDDHQNTPGPHSGTSTWTFSRSIHKNWALRKTFMASLNDRGPYNEVYWETHSLVGPSGDVALDDEWAEVDEKSVIYAAKGCLFRLAITTSGAQDPIRIADLNSNRFTAVIAPYAGLQRNTS